MWIQTHVVTPLTVNKKNSLMMMRTQTQVMSGMMVRIPMCILLEQK